MLAVQLAYYKLACYKLAYKLKYKTISEHTRSTSSIREVLASILEVRGRWSDPGGGAASLASNNESGW